MWVDTKKTQVKNKAGKLKEKEITILEVRLKDDRNPKILLSSKVNDRKTHLVSSRRCE